MRPFRIAITGDYLDEDGRGAYGDLGWEAWNAYPFLHYRFLSEQAPRRGDPAYWQRYYSMEVSAGQIAGLEGLVVLRPALTARTFANGAPDLVVVGRSGAGYDKIDLEACTAHDVAVFNAPTGLHHSTAAAALMFLMVLARKLPQQERICRQGRWDLQGKVMGGELQGRTLGIIGLGHSGRELARLVAPFSMRILAYSPHADPAEADRLGVRLASLEEVLCQADFLSMHCRLTPQTRRLLGAAELAKMKPTAYFVNVARGGLVDQAALTEALCARRLAGAALDVYEREPLPPDDPLLTLDNVVLTPHWSASTQEVWRITTKAMIDGMLRVATGRIPDNIVNPDVLHRPGFRTKLGRFGENATNS
jgi:phosphoglycerate dehydrogenase-like enzyme